MLTARVSCNKVHHGSGYHYTDSSRISSYLLSLNQGTCISSHNQGTCAFLFQNSPTDFWTSLCHVDQSLQLLAVFSSQLPFTWTIHFPSIFTSGVNSPLFFTSFLLFHVKIHDFSPEITGLYFFSSISPVSRDNTRLFFFISPEITGLYFFSGVNLYQQLHSSCCTLLHVKSKDFTSS